MMAIRCSTPGRHAAMLAAGAASIILALPACGGGTTRNSSESNAKDGSTPASANPNATIKSGLKIAFLPKQVNNPYFTTADTGGRKAVEAVKGVYKEVGTSSATDTAGQVSYVNTLSRQEQHAIVVSAQDPGALCPALKQAMASKIAVVTYDSDTNRDCRQVFVNQASAEAIGRSQIQLLGKELNYTGEIAILSAAQTATNQNTWIGFMREELKDPKYARMKLVNIAYGNDDPQKSFQETQGMLQSNPSLKGIIAPTTVAIKAAAQYLSGSQYKGKVQLTGLGTPNDMRQYVKDGTVQAFELWDPGKLGALAASTAAALASGVITGAEGQKFKAGDLGEYTIGAKGEVLLGPPTEFNKDNIDQFNF